MMEKLGISILLLAAIVSSARGESSLASVGMGLPPTADSVSLQRIKQRALRDNPNGAAVAAKAPGRPENPLFDHGGSFAVLHDDPTPKAGDADQIAAFAKDVTEYEDFKPLVNSLRGGTKPAEVAQTLGQIKLEAARMDTQGLRSDLKWLVQATGHFRRDDGTLDREALSTTLQAMSIPNTGQLGRALADLEKQVNENAAVDRAGGFSW